MEKRTPLPPNCVTERARQDILDELAKIVQTPHFVSSKRYPAFLTYVVEQALTGHADDLKERTIGIDVFHRRPDYDTNSDTVVRFTAGEVRKRLIAVYRDSGPERTIHIELPAGSYVPEFFEVTSDQALGDDAPAAHAGELISDPHLGPPPAPVPLASAGTLRARRSFPYVLMLAFVLVAVSVVALRWWKAQRDALNEFWRPVVSSRGPVILIPGAMAFAPDAVGNVKKASKTDPYPYISVSTAHALSDMVAMFASKKTDYVMRPTSEVFLSDLRGQPVVLIGAYSNEWTLRLIGGLRYRLTDQPEMGIYDSTNPSRRWARPAQVAYEEADDYAVVARFRDQLTDSYVVVVGGIGKNGTEAAAQFITSDRYLNLLNTPQSRDWATKNVEFILKTKVVDGREGSPTVETVYTW